MARFFSNVRLLRGMELVLVFGIFPVLLIYTQRWFPLIPTILILAGALLVVLRLHGWKYHSLLVFGTRAQWRHMLVLFLGIGTILGTYVYLGHPEWFLAFPKSEPLWWLAVICVYPFLSALPQEFIYRTFFFTRYSVVFGNSSQVLVPMSGLLFMWGHILFMNPVALVATAIGGSLFAWRFHQSRSLLLVTVEHALYGNLFFTLGLGRFIFSGAL